MRGATPADRWLAWRANAKAAADDRWRNADKMERPSMPGAAWLTETAKRFVQLSAIGILQPREQGRIKSIRFDEISTPDQERLKKRLSPRQLFAFTIASDPSQPTSRDRFVSLSDGKRLHAGRLSMQVFIDEHVRRPIGMNIQLSGRDPARSGRPTYLRYDLDPVAMGADAGPVTHFNAHWHTGDEPDGTDASTHDPRLPSLVLDPLAVLDVLVETYFPDGPDDVEELH